MYNDAAEDELKLLHQTAKVKWFKEGDRNSAFFHSILKARKHKSKVESICGEDVPVKPLSELGDIVQMKLNEDEAKSMIAWHNIGKDVCMAIKEFTNGKILGEINATLTALVPKIDTPDNISDFRPIAFCNLLLRIRKRRKWDSRLLVQLLVNRGQMSFASLFKGESKRKGLNFCNLVTQAGRGLLWLLESIRVVSKRSSYARALIEIRADVELKDTIEECPKNPGLGVAKNLKKPSQASRGVSVGSKVRFKPAKEYRTVSKKPTTNTSSNKKKGVEPTRENVEISSIGTTPVVDKIMKLEKLIIDGKVTIVDGDGGRGLRQGDSVSPYIFTLVMKVFNMILIREIRESKNFKFHYGCKELQLTHVFFTNDFKRTIFFGSVNKGIKRELLQVLPFKCGSLLMKYLGVPLVAKSLGANECQSLIENMSMIRELENLFKRFLWGAGDSLKGKARFAWSIVCRPKEQGDLGIKPLKRWNEVLLGSQLGLEIHGPLDSFIPAKDIYDARFKSNEKVCDIINNNKWDWPAEWADKYHVLIRLMFPLLDVGMT
ncbi:hypothetical protein Tco_0243499 [Tanacetum coccineum]